MKLGSRVLKVPRTCFALFTPFGSPRMLALLLSHCRWQLQLGRSLGYKPPWIPITWLCHQELYSSFSLRLLETRMLTYKPLDPLNMVREKRYNMNMGLLWILRARKGHCYFQSKEIWLIIKQEVSSVETTTKKF